MELVGNKRIRGDKLTGQTTVPWIFTGGDSATGPRSVIDAIAGGERAAVGMDDIPDGQPARVLAGRSQEHDRL
jgi:NADH-quinone oxidoreductase subunit F